MESGISTIGYPPIDLLQIVLKGIPPFLILQLLRQSERRFICKATPLLNFRSLVKVDLAESLRF